MNTFPGDRMNCSFAAPEAPSASFNFSLSLLEEDLTEEVEWAHVAQLLFYVTVMVLSLLGNLLVVIAVLTQRSMRTTVNYYLLNMAVADVLIVIFCMWVHFMKTYIFTSSYKLGPFMCRIESFAKMTCLTACVLTLTAISCDRFIAILFPLHAAARITKRRTSCVILFIWIVSTVVAIPLIVYSKLYNVQFAGQEEMSFCGSSWPSVSLWSAEKSECVLVSTMRKLYYVTATVLLFFLPIAVMLTAYSFIIWKLWINRVPEELSNTNNNSLHNRSKKKVVQMVCYVLVAFIVCWMPLQVTVLYSQFRGDSNKQMPAWFTTLSSFATNLAFSNSLVNPVIYGGFNRQFRQAILQLLKCKATRVQEARMRWSTRDGTMAVRRPASRKRPRDPLTAFDNCQDSVVTISNMVA